MNARFPHPAGQGTIAPGPLHDDTIGDGGVAVPGPACCCPANPVVRVVMPATAARPACRSADPAAQATRGLS
jgi:hypothetical protein